LWQKFAIECVIYGVVDTVAIGKAGAACGQSFALWQQATIEITRRDHSIIACSRHTYVVLFFAHIPFVLNHTFPTSTERLQQYRVVKK